MARPVEDAGGDLRGGHALGLGEARDILLRRAVEIDGVLGIAAADRDLVHIGVGRMQQAAPLRHRHAGDRVGHRLGAQRRAFQRIERDVDRPLVSAADLLADIEHRRLVALALADDDETVDIGDRIERLAHGIDRRLVGRLLIAPAPPARRGDRRGFGDAGDLDGEHAVEHGLPA